MNRFQQELETAKIIAKQAGSIMLEYFDADQQKEIKQDGTPVTIADKLINTMVIDELRRVFPNDIVIGEEESTGGYGMGRRWFCDPIDGTKGYTWGTPTAMFSLGLVIDGMAVLGVAYDPFLDRLYYAVKGGGTFCNDQPIRVSKLSLREGVVAIGSSARELRRGLPYLDTLLDNSIQTAVFSGAVYKMMLVARGKAVGYTEALVNAHDMAASHVIVEEAGGTISDMRGNTYDYTRPFRGTIVSNGVVHDELVAIINEERYENHETQ